MPEVTYTPSLPILQAVLRSFVNKLNPSSWNHGGGFFVYLMEENAC